MIDKSFKIKDITSLEYQKKLLRMKLAEQEKHLQYQIHHVVASKKHLTSFTGLFSSLKTITFDRSGPKSMWVRLSDSLIELIFSTLPGKKRRPFRKILKSLFKLGAAAALSVHNDSGKKRNR